MYPADLDRLVDATGSFPENVLIQLSTYGTNDDNGQNDVAECIRSGLESGGFDAVSLATGAPVDLVICNARDWTELFSRPQSDRIVLRNGISINTILPDYAVLDHLMETNP